MEMDQENLAVQYKALKTLQAAFAGGLIMFATIVYVLTRDDQHPADWSDPKVIMAILLIAVLVPLSFILYNRGLAKVKATDNADEKIALYRGAFILRAAMLEGCTLYSIIQVFLSHCHLYYVLVAIPLTVFLASWITLDKMKQDLGIN